MEVNENERTLEKSNVDTDSDSECSRIRIVYLPPSGGAAYQSEIDIDELALEVFLYKQHSNPYYSDKLQWDELYYDQKLHFRCEAKRIVEILERYIINEMEDEPYEE